MEKTKLIAKESSHLRRRKPQIHISDGYSLNMSPIISDETIQMMMLQPQSQAQKSDCFTIMQFVKKIREDQQIYYPVDRLENQFQQSLYNMRKLQKINSNYINFMEQMTDIDCSHHIKVTFQQYFIVKHFKKDDPPSKINDAQEYKCVSQQSSRASISERIGNQNSAFEIN